MVAAGGKKTLEPGRELLFVQNFEESSPDVAFNIFVLKNLQRLIWRCPKMGGIRKWWVYKGKSENPNLKWMRTGGTPIPGNLHIPQDGFQEFFFRTVLPGSIQRTPALDENLGC